MNEAALRALLEPVVAMHGLEVDDIRVVPAGRRCVLRITLDGDGPRGAGPDLDQISDASRAISAALDASTVVGNRPYTLEVSSRGIGRPLTTAAHWRRNITRLVNVHLVDGSSLSGRIVSADVTGADLDTAGGLVRVDFDQVRKATVEVELNRPAELDDVIDEQAEEN